MAKKKDEQFRIDYTLNPKTQDVKLVFSQGKKRATLLWEDKKNTWKQVVRWCKGMECDMEYDDCGSSLDIWGSSANTRREVILDQVELGKEIIDLLYIASWGWDETREEKEWIRRKKIYATFNVSWRAVRREMYKVVSDLACNPKYIGADKRFQKESKLDLLSYEVAKSIDPDGWYTKHSSQVLACLKNSAFCATDFYNRGLALYNDKKYKQALKDYNTALRKKKELGKENLTWCYRERGRVYQALKQYKKAEKDFLTAIKRDPKNPKYSDAYSSLEQLYTNLKKYDKALSWKLKEYKFNQADPALVYNIGIEYKRKKQWKQALKFFTKAHEQRKTEASDLIQLGLCNLNLRKFKIAKEICENVLNGLCAGELSFQYPDIDYKLLMKWAEDYLKHKEFDLASRLAIAGKAQGFKGYEPLLKKIAKKVESAKKR